MKRVKSACVLQTLIFSQKPELNYTKETALKINREEIKHYCAMMERSRVRYQITDTIEHEDGSIVVYVRKQHNNKTDVSEYFA